MIREAEYGDIEALVRMGSHTFADSPYMMFSEYDAKSTDMTMRSFVNSPIAAFVVADEGEIVGAACAIIAPAYFNHTTTLAQELFWWLEPGHRGLLRSLIAGLEDAAYEKGAEFIIISSLRESVRRLYERNGYQPSEQHYMKRLT